MIEVHPWISSEQLDARVRGVVVLKDTVKDDMTGFKIGRLAMLALALCLCCRTAILVGGQPPDDNKDHGVTAKAVLEEVKAAGFVDVQQSAWSSPAFLVSGRRPQ